MTLPLRPGSNISHYRILSGLGSGGMGEVYLALDTILGRKVAIKVLPAEFTSDAARIERFRNEARAACLLNHPNVAQIYEFAESEGILFISMEYVEGNLLSEVIAAGILEIQEVLDFAIQISDALGEAHTRGIIHRDVKPSNILVTPQRRLKILDFGIAKLTRPSDTDLASEASTLFSTKAGIAPGTVPYMSPEQLRGHHLDFRSDIFSFGAVLYEMVCGRRAFPGSTAIETIDAILNSQPQSLALLKNNLPAELDRIIRRCLEKDREQRYPSVSDARTDLGNLQRKLLGDPVSISPEKPSILVLPFEDVSPNADNEYFSDGLTDEIITDLSQIDQLRVISRASAMKFKRTSRDIRSLGREMNVRYILQGSVRKAGTALRITAQLIDVATDSNLWSDKYKGSMDDIFDIQEQVSRSIVQSLNPKLTSPPEKHRGGHPIGNAVAYQSYLRARYVIWALQPDAFQLAERELLQALQIAGHNELLYATLGWVYSMAVESGLPFEDYIRKAEGVERDLTALNPGSPYLYGLRGIIAYRRGNTRNAILNLEQALSADPKNPDFLLLLSYCYILAGMRVKARPLIDSLLEVDPLTALNHSIRAFLDYQGGNFDQALSHYLRACDLAPTNPVLILFHAWCLTTLARYEEALSVLETCRANADPETVFQSLATFAVHCLKREPDRARVALTEDLARAGRSIEFIARFLMDFLCFAGAREEAIQWLETDVRLGFQDYHFLAERSPFLALIRNDERVQAILKQLQKGQSS